MGTLTVGGYEAAERARRAGEAILARVRRLVAARGIADFAETSIEVIGAETMYGPWRRPEAAANREVVLKVGARHADPQALEILARELAPAGSSMAQGITGFFAGRPSVQPVLRLFSLLWPKENSRRSSMSAARASRCRSPHRSRSRPRRSCRSRRKQQKRRKPPFR